MNTGILYFSVIVKCGHVGRNNYIDKNIYIRANNAKKAASIARNTPRVKHHHKDAIREVKEINYDEYVLGMEQMNNDSYFHVKSHQEQVNRCNDIYELTMREERVIKSKKKSYKKQKLIERIMDREWEHIIVGEIINISLDNHPYQETFVQLNVSGGDVNDDQVHLMIRDNVNVTVPATDVLEIF